MNETSNSPASPPAASPPNSRSDSPAAAPPAGPRIELRTPLCDLLGCRYPIIQTAMGWVADARLVAATCNAGGFGFLAGATIPPDAIEAAIDETARLTDAPFGVNFHLTQPNAEQIIQLVIERGVRAVSYGRAPSGERIAKLRDAGVACVPTVGALKHAEKAVRLGASAVVVQGGEGGGHTGAVASTVLLPQVIDAVGDRVPVAAAGGFRDGRGLAAALAFGAAGVAMGTRFLMTRESSPPEATKRRYVACEEPAEMVVSRALDGLPQRMMRNAKLRQLEEAGALRSLALAIGSALKYRAFTGASPLALLRAGLANRRAGGLSIAQTVMSANAPMIIQRAMVDGEPDDGVLPGGQVAGAIGDLPSCAELIESMVAEARQALAKLIGDGAAEERQES